jgi:uncharacterized protein YuzE
MVESKQVDVKVGAWSFDRAAYDARGDVLYLQRGEPARAVAFDASEEGHAVQYDDQGRVVGLTIVNARWLIDHEGGITITLAPQRVEARDLGQLVTSGAH